MASSLQASNADNEPIGVQVRMELRLPRVSVRRQEDRRATLWLLFLSAPMLIFLVWPLVALVTRIPLSLLIENLSNLEVIQAIRLSLTTTALSTSTALLFGTPLAYLLARRDFRGRASIDTLIDLPMVLPPSVAGIALLIAFGRRGWLGAALNDLGLSLAFTTAAVVMAQIFVAAPFYIKAAIAGFAGVDRDLEKAAAIDGANAWQIFRHITAPLARSALFGGAVMTWARALGEFGATIIFAGNFPGRTQTMPLAIYIGLELELSVALTLSAILLATSFLVLFVVKRLLRQQLSAV
ncbi:MAG: ABC transporter permease [Caldilinea sp.]|uniref:ABC transporter permease n=1 Tax=Caldilinea sp. TaxID=2293560 RepID=UPI002C2D74ED|nr:ABC transporter permease [Caldilinea sp.]HRA65804.1 ABC transporter permease [Caldilinea sp.]